MNSRVPESELQLSLRDTLMKVSGAEISDSELSLPAEAREGRVSFEVKITDPEKWAEFLQSPEGRDIFGDISLAAYGDKKNPPIYDKEDSKSVEAVIKSTVEGDIGAAENIIIIAGEDGVQSLLAYESYQDPDDRQEYGYAYLNVTLPKHRQKGLGTSLLDQLYAKGLSGVSCVTSTPAAVKVVLNAAEKNGYDLFLAGRKIDEAGSEPTSQQKKVLDELNSSITEAFDEQGTNVEGVDLPPGYISYAKEMGAIPPPKKSEVSFDNEYLQDFFNENVVEKQKLVGKKGTVYATLIGLKRK